MNQRQLQQEIDDLGGGLAGKYYQAKRQVKNLTTSLQQVNLVLEQANDRIRELEATWRSDQAVIEGLWAKVLGLETDLKEHRDDLLAIAELAGAHEGETAGQAVGRLVERLGTALDVIDRAAVSISDTTEAAVAENATTGEETSP